MPGRALPLRGVAAALTLAAALLALFAPLPAQAGASSRYCDGESSLTAEHKDRLLRLAALVKGELERSGAEVAIVTRTGLDLARWDIRHSHAGLSVKHGADIPWSVRQLYYACDEGLPRIYDQGLAAFLFGADRPSLGYVSVVTLPAEAAPSAPVQRAALDNALALAMLAGRYSANAFAFSTRYQNCNQWLVELLAAAWAGINPGPEARELAQQWLALQHYEPTRVAVGWRPLMWAGATFVPWLHNDDHPEEDLAATTYRVSLPAAVEGLVRAQVPGAERVQFCYTAHHVLVRRGWGAALAEGCVAEVGDEVMGLD